MVCCATGHRPKGFPFQREADEMGYQEYLDRLYREVKKIILEGSNHFITGMAEGADIDFADFVIHFRDDEEFDITLEAALPYPISQQKMIETYSDYRYAVFTQCDRKTIVSPHYFKGCMQKRNCYMVDQSDVILAIWNGKKQGGTWNTIRYARSKGKTIRYIMLKEILK